MVIDLGEAVSATKYLSVNSDNANKLFHFFSPSKLLTLEKNSVQRFYMLVSMMSEAGWHRYTYKGQ